MLDASILGTGLMADMDMADAMLVGTVCIRLAARGDDNGEKGAKSIRLALRSRGCGVGRIIISFNFIFLLSTSIYSKTKNQQHHFQKGFNCFTSQFASSNCYSSSILTHHLLAPTLRKQSRACLNLLLTYNFSCRRPNCAPPSTYHP